MKPSVLLIALGGTISMQGNAADGITPKLSGADLVAAVPGLEDVCTIRAESPFRIPGASLTIGHIAQVASLIQSALASGTAGVVVVQGTDTIEETAFLLDCLVETDRPVVVTGAMRGADAAGADGPANILAAATYAASDGGLGLGTVVVFNDEIHAARLVRKTDTGLLSAFTSAPSGPIGRVSEGRVQIRMLPVKHLPPLPIQMDSAIPSVALVSIGFGDDDRMIRSLPDLGYAGAVLIGLGAGHVPEQTAESIGALAHQMPVALATRVVSGPVFTGTYGFVGSEIDLIRRGVMPSGDLGAAKTRLLLQLALARCSTREDIAALFSTL